MRRAIDQPVIGCFKSGGLLTILGSFLTSSFWTFWSGSRTGLSQTVMLQQGSEASGRV